MKPLPEDELPLLLPDVDEIHPSGTGESPLANVEEWVNTVDPETGMKARRETNTMPQWAGSCWYYMRYIDPHNNEATRRSGAGEEMAAGRPVYRRCRACGAAPALRAFLAQGAV